MCSPSDSRSTVEEASQLWPCRRPPLLTSPWPESVYAFAPIWAALALRLRLFAVDLPGLLGEIQTPVLIVAGLRDAVVPLTNAEFLAARLPHSR